MRYRSIQRWENHHCFLIDSFCFQGFGFESFDPSWSRFRFVLFFCFCYFVSVGFLIFFFAFTWPANKEGTGENLQILEPNL